MVTAVLCAAVAAENDLKEQDLSHESQGGLAKMSVKEFDSSNLLMLPMPVALSS